MVLPIYFRFAKRAGALGALARQLNADRIDHKRLTLPAELRLRRKSQFEAAYANGRRLGDGYFSVTISPNEIGRPRLGLAVATKVAGNSVKRNRIRRIVRESFRLTQHEIPAVDLIVGARTRAQGASSAELRTSLAALWDKVRKQCASPQKS